MNFSPLLDPLTVGVLAVLVVVYPVSGVLEYRRLVRRCAENDPDARMRHFDWIVASEWITVIVLLSWWFQSGRTAAPVGLAPDASGWQWLAVAVGVALVAVLVVQAILVTRNPESVAAQRDALGTLEHMVPRTPRERRAFDRLAITAGVCEEVLYRGLLLAVLTDAIGTWPAVLVSSVVFGLGHIYQGPTGFVKTATVGLVFALLTVFSGSVFTAIVVHAVLDIVSGRIMSAALAHDGPAGDGPPDETPGRSPAPPGATSARFLSIVAAVLIGAAVNVAIACAGALWTNRLTTTRSEIPVALGTEWWDAHAPAHWHRGPESVTQFTGAFEHTVLYTEFDGSSGTLGNNALRVYAGFPLRSLTGVVWVDRALRSVTHVHLHGTSLGWGTRNLLPGRPLVPGTIGNTAFYAALVLLALRLREGARRDARRRRGRCPSCGYAVHDATVCPECGQPCAARRAPARDEPRPSP